MKDRKVIVRGSTQLGLLKDDTTLVLVRKVPPPPPPPPPSPPASQQSPPPPSPTPKLERTVTTTVISVPINSRSEKGEGRIGRFLGGMRGRKE